MMLGHAMGSEVETAFAKLRGYAEKAGRDPGQIGLEVWVSTGTRGPADWRKEFQYWKSVGVTHVTVNSTFNRGPHQRIAGRTIADHLAAMKQYHTAVGLLPVGNSPDEMAAVIAAETPRWAKLIKEAGIRISE